MKVIFMSVIFIVMFVGVTFVNIRLTLVPVIAIHAIATLTR